jgi:hypothetical protein
MERLRIHPSQKQRNDSSAKRPTIMKNIWILLCTTFFIIGAYSQDKSFVRQMSMKDLLKPTKDKT